MRVPVSTRVVHQLALRYGKVYEIWVLLVVLVMEGVHQDEGVALYVQTVLGDVVVVLYEFNNPISPIPKLHRYLLILQPRVVEM